MANSMVKGITRGVCAVLLAGAMVASAPGLALATSFGWGGWGGWGGGGGGGGSCYFKCDGGDGGGQDGGGGGCTVGCDGGTTKVPEPGTIVLMGAGLLGVALWARRREEPA